MPYTKTIWADEVPASTPIKYKVTDDSLGVVASSAKLELVTGVTAGTPLTALNMNKIETGIETAQAGVDAMLARVYPVGCIYTSTVATNPATVFGFGTWAAFGAGKVLVGLDAGQTEFDTVEETGGEKTHALIDSEMPAHTHAVRTKTTGAGSILGMFSSALLIVTSGNKNVATFSKISGTLSPIWARGGGTDGGTYGDTESNGVAHNNLQPYIVVYFWKRTA